MPFARLDDVELHYETAGDPTHTPVVLIMGLGGRGNGWDYQIEPLAETHRVTWFDNRGVGETRARPGRYSTGLLASDALRLMDHLGWPDAHVVGVSMGGMIAQELALMKPDRVRSLSLIATHPGGVTGRLPTATGVARFVRVVVGRRRSRLPAMERLLFTPEYLEGCDRALLRSRLRRNFTPVPRRYLASQISVVLGHRTAPRLARLAAVPTLIVKAGKDVLVRPNQSDRLHRLIPNSRLLVLEDAGHGVIRQAAERVNAALLEHFATADGAR